MLLVAILEMIHYKIFHSYRILFSIVFISIGLFMSTYKGMEQCNAVGILFGFLGISAGAINQLVLNKFPHIPLTLNFSGRRVFKEI
jgi:hypothetical protein